MGWLWWLIALLPVIGIIKVGVQSMADRYTYFPSIGLWLVVVGCVSLLLKKLRVRAYLIFLCVAVVIGGLVISTQKQVLKLLVDLRKAKIIESMIFVTHDIAVLRQIADRIAIMYAGKIVESASTDDILYNSKHPYTYGLINAVVTPEPEVRKRGLISIPGEPPNLLKPPSGCRFHPRCPYAMDICRREEPPLVEVGEGWTVACHLVASGRR